MKYFSGKGDEGKTRLIAGKLLNKDEQVFDLLGTLDELTANLGVAISLCDQEEITRDLQELQQHISKLMGMIVLPRDVPRRKQPENKIPQSVCWLEERLQQYGSHVKRSRGFIFSGKTQLGAALDVARTVTRRAERVAVSYCHSIPNYQNDVLVFLNRISSFLYFLRLFVDK